MNNSRQVLRRIYRDAAMTSIPTRAQVGEQTKLIDRRVRRLMARSFGNRKFRAERNLPEHEGMRRRLGLRK